MTLTIAVGDYDHTRDLASGVVATPSLEARWEVLDTPEEIFTRLLERGDFDAAEMSMAVYTTLRSRQDASFIGVPVFPARSFRHSAIYTRVGGPETPRELDRARVGIPAWAQTAGVYARGMLADEFDVSLESVKWVQAGVDEPGRAEPVKLDYGKFDVTPASNRSLNDLLVTGDVDAVISARPPAAIEQSDRRVRRMFRDPQSVEELSFKATGVFPIMHVLALRASAVRGHPNAPKILFESFSEAKRRSYRRMTSATVPTVPLPWAAIQARAVRELMGDDWWPYGVSANRTTLETFLRYAHEQGLTTDRLTLAELFPNGLAQFG